MNGQGNPQWSTIRKLPPCPFLHRATETYPRGSPPFTVTSTAISSRTSARWLRRPTSSRIDRSRSAGAFDTAQELPPSQRIRPQVLGGMACHKRMKSALAPHPCPANGSAQHRQGSTGPREKLKPHIPSPAPHRSGMAPRPPRPNQLAARHFPRLHLGQRSVLDRAGGLVRKQKT